MPKIGQRIMTRKILLAPPARGRKKQKPDPNILCEKHVSESLVMIVFCTYPPKKAMMPRSRSGRIKNRIVRLNPIVRVRPERKSTSPRANMALSKRKRQPRNKKTQPRNRRALPILVLSLKLNMIFFLVSFDLFASLIMTRPERVSSYNVLDLSFFLDAAAMKWIPTPEEIG